MLVLARAAAPALCLLVTPTELYISYHCVT